MQFKDLTKKKQKPIFATMSSADFYPEGANKEYIEITVAAPFDTIVLPGKVVIISEEDYLRLTKV